MHRKGAHVEFALCDKRDTRADFVLCDYPKEDFIKRIVAGRKLVVCAPGGCSNFLQSVGQALLHLIVARIALHAKWWTNKCPLHTHTEEFCII